MREHGYEVEVGWTGATTSYREYTRAHEVTAGGKTPIPGSADPAFRGDRDRYNPEELLVASLSQCHMLWFLHLAANAGIVVTSYRDRAVGTMVEDGGGRFTGVTLRPEVTVHSGREKLTELHDRAHHLCFIANSVNFPVTIEPGTVQSVD
ncbi:OsmC family protein [Kutzneria buriramensis]|uniref:Organic hydroperoxide reductase OsmC/OhrA n=1 Tax=Kutzneria buriramensis TaxID=1045776 RepID=A0A3E0GTJ9_9PSEU|nr:OsmC family protein [Kutzneria buriramensis]REH27054.1 organic hydroperoxide reductase OsmC/OhrA [Kutzneria buriramensis]